MESIEARVEALFAQTAERRVLDNGLTVLVREDASSQVSSVQMWVKSGSIHEGSLLGAGVSHFLEHMLFKGTGKRTGKQISREVQGLGGQINAYTSFDRTVYYIDLPSEHTLNAIDILADACFNSVLPEEEVQMERDVILREIDMGLDDPDCQLSRALFETAFRIHPYKYPVIGYKDLFKTISRQDLIDYYHGHYVPNNAVLVIAGDVVAEDVFEEANRIFASYPRKRLEPVFIPEEPASLARRQQSLTGDVNISRIGLGFSIPGLRHADSPGLSLLAGILGNGESSILWERLRQNLGVVHHIEATSWNPGTSGLLWISMITDVGKQEEVLKAFWKEIAVLKKSLIEEARLEKARRQAMVGEVNSRKTMSGQAGRIGAAEVVVGDLEYPKIQLERIQEVSAEDLRRLLNTYLVEERLTQVTLNPEAGQSAVRPAGETARENPFFEAFACKNGARLLLQPGTRFPKIHLRVIFKGGPLYEPPGQRGISALVATLLTQDTVKRSAVEVATRIESVGGNFSEFSGNNTLGFGLEVLPQDLDVALDLLEEALLYPTIDPETFERERDAQIAHIKESLDDVVEFGICELSRAFFGEHPYAVNPRGTVESLARLEPEAVRVFRETLTVAENCVIAASGLFECSRLEERLRAILERLPSGSLKSSHVPPFISPALTGRKDVFQDREQAVVFQAFPGVGVLQDEPMTVAAVLDELFSGMSSQLFERVRDELGLAYFVGSSRMIGMETGMFFLYGGTHPSTAEKVLEEMSREVDRVKAGQVEPDELERVKIRLKAQRRMSLQAIGSRAMQAGLNATYGQPINDWLHFDEKVDRVSAGSLASFCREYLDEAKRLELIVRPGNAGSGNTGSGSKPSRGR